MPYDHRHLGVIPCSTSYVRTTLWSKRRPRSCVGEGRDEAGSRSRDVPSAQAFWSALTPLGERRRACVAALREGDLARPVEYLGVDGYTVGKVVRTHAAHFTGHTWQVKYVRGAYSRAFGTDKRVFDPM